VGSGDERRGATFCPIAITASGDNFK
jgi:hypothetical protein